ncbi:L-2-amino-thiazoline-4-carboxylic acid hydrolase [Faecalibacterium prausnitzii]|nr:L-2-amino-thiazoline-4-carboxylic acid hydrolase [Faecalibacterium prausnitzii]
MRLSGSVLTYDGLHPKLIWRRTKTLGRGDDCCDFTLHCQKVSFIWPHR